MLLISLDVSPHARLGAFPSRCRPQRGCRKIGASSFFATVSLAQTTPAQYASRIDRSNGVLFSRKTQPLSSKQRRNHSKTLQLTMKEKK
jgi:hypothetical protein